MWTKICMYTEWGKGRITFVPMENNTVIDLKI